MHFEIEKHIINKFILPFRFTREEVNDRFTVIIITFPSTHTHEKIVI